MSKKQVMRRLQAQGALRGAPRSKSVVNHVRSRNTPKPKGSHGGKMQVIHRRVY